MEKVLTILTAIAIIVTMTMSAYAFEGSGKSCANDNKKFDFAKRLNLSKNQLGKMKDLRSRFQNETRDLQYDLMIKRIEMRKLFTDPKTDEATLLAKQKELSDLRQQLHDKRAQMKIEWRKILTPEQITKLGQIPHKWGARGRGSDHYQHHGA
ncbi:MAG: Spy/CpxP family protein refolding chaperone [Syntrophales bacterium]|jgi:Spy/CpxP family protein refolding chaperone